MYDAWGNILQQSGAMAAENPLRYKGYRYDTETNLYYLVARYYEPTTGVFLSRDPQSGSVTSPLSQNGYAYADNNPVMLADHDGENPLLIINISLALYDGYKVYSAGGSKKEVAAAVGMGLLPTGKLKGIGKAVGFVTKGIGNSTKGGLNFTKTTLKHMDNPGRFVPVQTLQQAIKGKGFKDPRGSSATMYYTTMYRNGKKYNLEVLYDKKTKTILHFEYARKAMGPLRAIPK